MMVKRCPACGHDNLKEDWECTSCGHALTIDDLVEVRTEPVSPQREAKSGVAIEPETPKTDAPFSEGGFSGIICPICGVMTPEGGIYCFQCGSRINKECPRCAEVIKYKATQCRYCGYQYSSRSFSEVELAERKRFLVVKEAVMKYVEGKDIEVITHKGKQVGIFRDDKHWTCKHCFALNEKRNFYCGRCHKPRADKDPGDQENIDGNSDL